MMRRWHSTSKASSTVVLLVLWLPIIPWCVYASEDGNISGNISGGSNQIGSNQVASNQVGSNEAVGSNESGSNEIGGDKSSEKGVALGRSAEEFNIELNFMRWGSCQKPELGKPLKCCSTDFDTETDKRFYACEEIYLSDATKMVQARFEVGDFQRSFVSRYMSEINSFFNVTENPAWAEISKTPIGEMGDIPFSYFLGRPIQNIFNRALNRSLAQSLNPDIDRRRIEKRLEDLKAIVNKALNHTINELVNESLDSVFSLDDEDFNFVSSQWFRLRNLSLESIVDTVLTTNTANMTGVESILRIAWRLFINQQQESFDRLLSNPGDMVAWVFNTYMSLFSNNRTNNFLNSEALRGFVQYLAATESYQVTIPLCYTPQPGTSLCWNIYFLVNTNKWTLRKKVKLSVESNLLAPDSLSLDIFDMSINGTGFRNSRHEGVCMYGKISMMDMPNFPLPRFEVNCHPVFYHPFQYIDTALCLIYERLTRNGQHLNSTIGKVCVDPIQSTLAREIVKNFIRITVYRNNLEPQNNKICRNLVHQLHSAGRGTPRDEFMTRAMVEMLSMSIQNMLGVRTDRRTVSQVVRIGRALPIIMDGYGALSQISNSTDVFNKNLMECGVLLLEHGEQHRAMAMRPNPVGRLVTPARGVFGRELPRWRQLSDHRLGPPQPRASSETFLDRLIPDRRIYRRTRRSGDSSKGDAPSEKDADSVDSSRGYAPGGDSFDWDALRGDPLEGDAPSEDSSKRSVRSEGPSKMNAASGPEWFEDNRPKLPPTGRKLLQWGDGQGDFRLAVQNEEGEQGENDDPNRDPNDIPSVRDLPSQDPDPDPYINPGQGINRFLASAFGRMDQWRFRLRDFLDGQRVNLQSRIDNWWDVYMTRFRLFLEGIVARVLGTITSYAPGVTREP